MQIGFPDQDGILQHVNVMFHAAGIVHEWYKSQRKTSLYFPEPKFFGLKPSRIRLGPLRSLYFSMGSTFCCFRHMSNAL